VNKLVATIINSGACLLSCNKKQFREFVYAVKDCPSGRYDEAKG